jgi:hypothetical protein
MKSLVVCAILCGVIAGSSVVAVPKFKATNTGMSNSGLKVYYAHDEEFYGTSEESNDLETLGKFGMNIVDPSWPSIQDIVKQMRADGSSKEEISEYLLRYVDSCDAVVFRKMDDGTISKDVQDAIERAKGAGKPVLQIPVIPEKTVK